MPEAADRRLRAIVHKSQTALLGTHLPPGPGRRNWRMIMVIQGAWACFLGTSIMSTYYTKEMGLSNVQVFMLQATWASIATLGSTIGGWLADRYGIRKVMLCGTAISVMQAVYLATCREFWQFEIALVGTGLQAALLGGTCDTLCTVTLRRAVSDPQHREELFKQYHRVASRIRALMILVATLGGNFLATQISMHVPFMLQGAVNLIPLIAVWRTVELREPAPHLTISTIRKQLRLLVVDRPDIRWAVASYVVTGATSIAGYWLIQPYMNNGGIDVTNFGWIYACQSVCIGLLTWATRALQRAGPILSWSVIAAATGMGCVGASLYGGYVGVAIVLAGFALFRACATACLATYLYKRLGEDDFTRSIDISIVDAIQTLVFGIVGIGVGFVADSTSPGAAYLVIGGGCLILNSVVLYRLWHATRAF